MSAEVDFISRRFSRDNEVDFGDRGVGPFVHKMQMLNVRVLNNSFKYVQQTPPAPGETWRRARGHQQPVPCSSANIADRGRCVCTGSTGALARAGVGRRSKFGGTGVGTGVASPAAHGRTFLSPWGSLSRLAGSSD